MEGLKKKQFIIRDFETLGSATNYLRGLSGKYPDILNTSRTGRMALM